MKKADKQKEVTAASFKRIAKAIRGKRTGLSFEVLTAKQLARIFDDEAKRLRVMR